MRTHRRTRGTLLVLAAMAAGCSGAPTATEAPATTPSPWPQWGGPTGDFRLPAADLSEHWPEAGPPVVWQRPLGEGYSGVAAGAETLFTMYRDGDDDVAVALRLDDGSTLWEHRYPAPTHPDNVVQFGQGPNATPLVLDDRVVFLGYTGILTCLDRHTGDPSWRLDLIADLGGEVLAFGYSASPVLDAGRVLVLVGGDRHGLVALDPADGTVAWSGPPSSASYATPIVIDVDGERQAVYYSADELIGLAAEDGTARWRHPVVNQYRNNATAPLWSGDGLLVAATQLDGGTRALGLSRRGDATSVAELWFNPRISIHFWNALMLGEHVFASIGSNASILAAIDRSTGEIVWRRRGYEQANLLQVGERTLLLDAEGHLALVRLDGEGLTVLSEARIADGPTWTAPTLVGSTLIVRDRRTIRALDLSSR